MCVCLYVSVFEVHKTANIIIMLRHDSKVMRLLKPVLFSLLTRLFHRQLRPGPNSIHCYRIINCQFTVTWVQRHTLNRLSTGNAGVITGHHGNESDYSHVLSTPQLKETEA